MVVEGGLLLLLELIGGLLLLLELIGGLLLLLELIGMDIKYSIAF
jgi:hypothetical protein